MRKLRSLTIALLAIASACAEDNPTTLDAYAFGLSYHMGASGYREVNPGVGIGFSPRLGEQWDLPCVAGTYKDSYSKRGVIILAGPRWILGRRDDWNATAALMVGRIDGSGNSGVGVVPVVGVGRDWFHVEVTAIPGDPAVVGAWLRFSYQIIP